MVRSTRVKRLRELEKENTRPKEAHGRSFQGLLPLADKLRTLTQLDPGSVGVLSL